MNFVRSIPSLKIWLLCYNCVLCGLVGEFLMSYMILLMKEAVISYSFSV